MNQKGELVEIGDVTENDRHAGYFCLGCGKEMRPRMGQRNARHFAHCSKDFEAACSPETYLHMLAKRRIRERFCSGGPFEISLRQTVRCSDRETCPFYRSLSCNAEVYRTYNLKHEYDTCLEEEAVGDFRADLLLRSSSNPKKPPLLIEVCVTHECSDDKKASGMRILEVFVKSEQDIDRLLAAPFRESDGSGLDVRFHNFRRNVRDERLAVRRIPKFFLFRSGKAHVDFSYFEDAHIYPDSCYDFLGGSVDEPLSCRNVLRKSNPRSVLELAVDMPEGGYVSGGPIFGPLDESSFLSIYDVGFIKAEELGYDVRDCFRCRYCHRTDGYLEDNICALYKSKGTPRNPDSAEAVKCPYFWKKEKDLSLMDTVIVEVCR